MSKKHKKATKNHITFAQICTKWLEYSRICVKESTFEMYTYLTKTHILPYFGDFLFVKLDNNALNKFISEKSTHGKIRGKGGLSAKYLRDILSIIKSISRFCEETYSIPNRIKSFRPPKAIKKERQILNDSERKKLVRNLTHDGNDYNIGVLIAMYTGMRIGEICGLLWSDFDEEIGALHVRRTVQRVTDNSGSTRLLADKPKTAASERVIPLPEKIYKILLDKKNKLKKRIEKTENISILSGTEDFPEPAKLRRYFKAALKENKIKNIRFHDLRHGFATYCVQKNFDMKTISEILGHTNASTTLNLYTHSSLEKKREMMRKIKL